MTTEIEISPMPAPSINMSTVDSITLTSKFNGKEKFKIWEYEEDMPKVWTTVTRDAGGNKFVPLSRIEGNEFSYELHMGLLGNVTFWLDEKFNLICTNHDPRSTKYFEFNQIINMVDKYGRPFVTETYLPQVRELHKRLINKVVNIKVYYPELIK
jgi:hypothetical protein